MQDAADNNKRRPVDFDLAPLRIANDRHPPVFLCLAVASKKPRLSL